jgi:citrate/tricarballylate utilization protein
VSATGILLLVLRDTAAMGLTLAVHLGFVMAFFVMLPYGKFMHGIYRYLALARHERERREPNPYAFSDS